MTSPPNNLLGQIPEAVLMSISILHKCYWYISTRDSEHSLPLHKCYSLVNIIS